MREVVASGSVAPDIMVVFERQIKRGVWEIAGTRPPIGERVRLAYARRSPDGWIRVSRSEGDRYFGAFRIGVGYVGHGRSDWMAK